MTPTPELAFSLPTKITFMSREPSHPDHIAKALGSGQQFLDHAAKDIGETVIPAGVVIGEAFVIDAHEV